MRILWQHIELVLASYDGSVPLHHFLKGYFRNNPKLGSRDRRAISDAVYAWYRAGKGLEPDRHEAQILRQAAMYLCDLRPKALAPFFPESWPTESTGLAERISVLEREGPLFRPEALFPYDIPFSTGITAAEWRSSLLMQPRLFLRIRSGRETADRALQQAGIPCEWISDSCLSLPNGTKLEGLLPPDTYVVQDASSQATGSFLKPSSGDQWWDCCSGAGGKSLMLQDATPGLNLLATDVRQSILTNLRERFRLYHLKQPALSTLDAADDGSTARFMGSRKFDGIICDVPCSGSGTWARTPESCYFFEPASVAAYAGRQTAILRNACRFVKSTGRVVYVTCSVFRAENEEVIEAIAAEGNMRIERSGLINGLSMGADALFAAVLRPA